MTKVEIVEYSCGKYSVRRTVNFIFFKRISYYDMRDNKWRDSTNSYLRGCFNSDLSEIREYLMLTGLEEGTLLNEKNIVQQTELHEMNKMAETDEGMKDLLLKAKEFYLLKKK